MATEYEKAEDTYRLYRYDRENGHDTFLLRAEEAQRYYASDQWGPADRMIRRAEKRPTVTVNEIFETINSIAGELEQLSTDVRYQADSGSEETADVLNKLALHVDRQNKSYLHDYRVRHDGLLCGRGYYEIRMDFDDNLQGNVVMRARRPQNVILQAGLDSIDPSDWVRVTTTEVLSLQDVEELYGAGLARDMRGSPAAAWYDVDDRNLAQRMGYAGAMNVPGTEMDLTNQFVKQFRQVSTQYVELKKKPFFVDLSSGDMAEIPENWPNEKIQYAIDHYGLGTLEKKAKTIRWRVVVNDRVVHDEDSPYKYFTIVPFFPFFEDGVTLSLFDVLRGPQDLLNKSLSEEIHIMSSAANSGWKFKSGSLKNHTPRDIEQKGAQNGLVLVLDEVEDAQKIEPSTPPSGYEGLSSRAQQWTKQLAGLTPSMQGAQRADAAGEGIRIQLMRAPVNLTAPLTAFHFMKHLIAERKLNLFQTFYTETRMVKVITGSYGQTEEVGINLPVGDRIVNDLTLGCYSAQVLPTGSRMQAEEYAFDELVKLKELGITVPNNLFISVSAINAKADAVEALRAANSGDISPEEQAARELELRKMEADAMDAEAGVQNKQAQTELAIARAERARADAKTPAARIALDANRQRLEAERDAQNAALQRDSKSSDVALKLTEMEKDAALREQEIKVNAEVKKATAKAAAKKAPAKKKAATPKRK